MLASLALLQATVSIGPASMSLPDLAAALTHAGMPTACSPALRDRGALVSLHRRTPEATRRVLGEALGVAFVPEGPGWRMVADDAAKAQDRRLFAAYENRAARKAADWAEGERKAREGQAWATLVARVEDQAARTREGRWTPAELIARVAPISALARRVQPNTWIAATALRDAGFVRQAVAEGSATRSIPVASLERATGLPPIAYLPAAQRFGVDPSDPTGRVVAALKFDPLQGTLTVKSYMEVGGKQIAGERTFPDATGRGLGGGMDGYVATIDLEEETIEGTLAALGAAGTETLKRLAPAPDLPNRPVLRPAPWTLSLGLERLCSGSGRDLVMALSPRFEFAPGSVPGYMKPPPISFRSAFAPKASMVDGIPEYNYSAMKDGLTPEMVEASRERGARRKRPWRAIDRVGVWLVVNPLGFLDRLRPLSPVPFLQAERVLREQGGGEIPPAPTIATARRMARALPPVPTSEFMTTIGYRDLGLFQDLALLEMLRRLDSALPTAQAAFWRELREKRAASIDTKDGTITLRLDGDEAALGVVGGYLYPGTSTGGADLGYVRFDGRGTVLPEQDAAHPRSTGFRRDGHGGEEPGMAGLRRWRDGRPAGVST